MLTVQVIPRDRPLTYEWLEELGDFLLDRGWLSRAEKATWDLGGFFWRPIHTSGLCAIGLNSNHWTATQGQREMREAQLAWLPAILGRRGETAVCTSGFLLASHMGVVCPGAKVHGGTVRNSDGLWDATKASTQHCLEVRTLIDEAGPSAVVAELSGDLNKEHLYAAGTASYGFTAVGMSRRGGNDPKPDPNPNSSPDPNPNPNQARRQRPRLPSRHPQ